MTDTVFNLTSADGTEYTLTIAKNVAVEPEPDTTPDPDQPDEPADSGDTDAGNAPGGSDDNTDTSGADDSNASGADAAVTQAALLPTGITVQVGDTVQYNNPEPGQQYGNWSNGALKGIGGTKSGKYTAVEVGHGTIWQYHNTGVGKASASITVVADDGSKPRTYDKDGSVESSDTPVSTPTPKPSSPQATGDTPTPTPPSKNNLERLQMGAATGKYATVDFVIDGQSGTLAAGPNERVRGKFSDGTWSDLTIFNDPIVGVSPANALFTGPKTLPVDLVITIGDDELFNGHLDIPGRCRAHPYRNWTPQPLAEPKTELFLNYGDQAKASGPHWAKLAADADNGPFGLSYCNPAMETTGERLEIGARMANVAAAMTAPKDPGMLSAVRQVDDASGSWGYFLLDPATLLPPDPRTYPEITLLWAANSSKNPITHLGTDCKASLSQGSAHAPAFGVGGYAFYGSEFDRQNMVAWAMYTMRYWQNPGYCANGGKSVAGPDSRGYLHGQTRGFAWGLRTLIDAWIADPDNDLLDMMLTDFAAAVEYVFRKWDQTDGAMWYYTTKPYFSGYGMAPWQQDFLGFAFAHAVASGREEYRKTLNHLAQFQIQRANYYMIEVASTYDVYCKRKSDGHELYTWSEMMDESAKHSSSLRNALAEEPGSTAVQVALHGKDAHLYEDGDETGYATSPTGYPAMFNMALARICDAGVPGATEAYAKHKAHFRADGSFNPQYCLIPEA